MDSIMFRNLPENAVFDLEKMTALLVENGVDGFYRPSDLPPLYTTKADLEEVIGEIGALVPKQPFFSLFYKLDNDDFKAAYLYSPNFQDCLTFRYPKLENILNISKGLTQMVKIPLISIYEGDRWSLPKFQIYEAGSLVRETEPVGHEAYDPDFGIKDEQKLVERFSKNMPVFIKKFNTVFKNKMLG